MIRIIKKGVRLLVHDRTSVGARHPGWLLLAGFLVLPMIITCSSGSKGGTASVALLVKMPRTNQQQASYQNGFWARVWSWVTGVDAAWAQSVVQPPTCTGNCRLLIDVSASDLVPQYTTIQNVAAGYVNVSLSVPAGGGRIFRVTLLQDAGSGFIPIYAGCHSGVDLAGSASVTLPIELRTTTSCLRVVVLGGGAGLDQPLAGVRVLRHDSAGGLLEERTSDGNGIAEFGDIDPSLANPLELTTISFVLKRTQSTVQDPAGQSVLSLVDVPMTSDLRFNVALNRPDALTIDLPVQVSANPSVSSSNCVSTSGCTFQAGGSGHAQQVGTFAQGAQFTGLTTPLPIYQVQSDGNYSLALNYYDTALFCTLIEDQSPSMLVPAAAFPASSNPVTTNMNVVDSGGVLGQLNVSIDNQHTFYKQTLIQTGLSGAQIAPGNISYCPPPGGGKFGVGYYFGSGLFSVYATGAPSALTLPINNISGFSSNYDPISNSVSWFPSGADLGIAGAVGVNVDWVDPNTSDNLHRFLLIPADSPRLSSISSVQNPVVVLPQLPSDLSILSAPPVSAPYQNVEIHYYGAGQLDVNSASVAFSPTQIFSRLFGKTGSFDADVKYDSQTQWSFDVVLQLG